MKIKIVLCLFVLLLTIVLTGCGAKEEINNNGNNKEQQSTGKKEEEKKEENNTAIIDDEIIEFDDDDNSPTVEGTIEVKEVINCTGCVYAYFDKEGNEAIRIGDTLSDGEYTTNINNLKTKGGNQRHNFFGLVLSGNTILRAYACILKDSKIYCIEGSTNGAYHNSNIEVLKKVFTADQCKTISVGNTYTCTDGNYNGDTITTGFVSFLYETGCTVYGGDSSNAGKLICH